MYKNITRMLPRITRTKKFYSASRTQAAKLLCECVNPLSCSCMLHSVYILTYITYALYCHKNLVNLQKSLCTLYTNIAIFCVRCAQVFSINKYYFTTLWSMCELVVKNPKSGTLYWVHCSTHDLWHRQKWLYASSHHQANDVQTQSDQHPPLWNSDTQIKYL